MQAPDPNIKFENLALHPKLLDSLNRLKFTTPTPIQGQAIPVVLEGKDLLAIAQTGTGKTLAFGLPMLQNLNENKGLGLVLVPTRELAMQVQESFMKVAGHLGLSTVLLIGGAPIYQQKKNLRGKYQVIIATPGRLIDHLKQKNLHLNQVRALVLDEADRMLDMGFSPQIREILRFVPAQRQTLLFSATMPKPLMALANSMMHTPYYVEVAPSGTTAEKVEQAFVVMNKEDKVRELCDLLKTFDGTALIFTRTKHGASKLTSLLKARSFTAAEIHSNRTLGQRKTALEGFKKGRFRILVATDIAARGIDVKEIGIVINYDLPDNPEDYVHRIGRTGRAGKEGVAVSFVNPDQRDELKTIERLTRQELTVSFRVPFEKPVTKFAYKSRPRRVGGKRRR